VNYTNTLKNILSSLPHSPGIYQFFDAKKNIIYIGKSKNLKSRVNSYFSGKQKLGFAKQQMIEKIRDIQYILTNTETESLILENDLIKQYQPKYNILLKDGKNFLYIKITKESYPKILRTRVAPSQIKNHDGKYFWPYTSSSQVADILKLLKKIFGYGVGEHNFFLWKWSYNLDKYIFEGNTKSSEQEIAKKYREKIQQISEFLSGNTSEIRERTTREMQQKAKNLEFEEAGKRKQILEALSALWNAQIVRDGVKWNYFVVQILEKYDRYFWGIIEIIEGKIVNYEYLELENKLWEWQTELIKNICEQKWVEQRERKHLSFIIPKEINEISSCIKYEVPQHGAKYELLKLCYTNTYEYAHKKYLWSLSAKSFSKQTMKDLLKILGYSVLNPHIVFECNDISHLSWSHSVASRSVIEDGKKNPKKYKKFRVKTLSEGKIDDFHSMKEIMSRRILELEKLENYPDLLVIDGGKGQLWAAAKILREYPEVENKIQIVSLAKREEELFLPDNPKPILLKKDSPELRLVQALRDEAHRFAISFNRDSRSSAQKKNILEAIPWIGPKTRKKILREFWSVENLKNFEYLEIEKVLGRSTTENLDNHWLI
jgi:excinuclease ABC subunit C